MMKQLTKECAVYEYTGEGYKPLVDFKTWRVAVINWAERFDRANFERLERHNETDEVFILLDGEATLVVGEECRLVPMEKGKVYNISAGGWHHVIVDRERTETRLIVVENSDTCRDNTDYMLAKLPE